MASHDNFIDIYAVNLQAGQYKPIARCSGHSSYVTHLDWSCFDPSDPERRILQSTDGAPRSD